MPHGSLTNEDAARLSSLSFEVQCVLDARGRVLRVNDAWPRLFPDAEGAGRPLLLELIHPDDRSAVRTALRGAAKGEVASGLIARCVRCTGGYRLLDWRFSPGESGQVYVCARDVTERRRSAETVTTLRTLEDEAEQVAALGSWRIEISNGSVHWSPQMYRIFGIDPKTEALDLKTATEAVIHPDDRERMRAIIEDAFAGTLPRPAEFRIVHPDGEIRWLQTHGRQASDGAGRAVALIGFVQDITDQKMAEIRISESEQHFRAAFDQAAVGMSEQSPDGRFIRMNPRLSAILGYAPEELTGRAFAEITHPSDRDKDLAGFRSMVEGRADRFARDKRYIRKDGSFVWVHVTVAPVRGGGGHVKYFLVAVEDISDRRRAEDALLESNERLAGMLRGVAEAMGKVSEARDPYTQDHEVRVSRLAHQIGAEMDMSSDDLAAMDMACLLHDVGKLRVPVEILTKPGRLSATEFALIKEHSYAGHEILKGIDFPWPIAEIVLQHHERMDGSGYPRGLSGDDIMPVARVLAVADVIEAMATNRPYRAALGIEAAMRELKESASKYDPVAVAACVRLYEVGLIEL